MKWQGKVKVKYQSLSKNQKRQIVNGCGASNSRFRPPHFKLFADECGPHDYDYACGGTWFHKVSADFRLRSRILKKTKITDIQILRDNLYLDDALFPDWAIRGIYKWWANGYFAGVLFGGNSSFRFDWTGPQWPVMEGWGL